MNNKKKNNYYWLKAGAFFGLFEGIFWTWGIKVFEYFSPRYYIEFNDFLIGIPTLCLSIVFFGLFVKYVSKQVKQDLTK